MSRAAEFIARASLARSGALTVALAIGPVASAAAWTAETVPVPGPVGALRQIGDEVFVNANGWHRIIVCDDGQLCLAPAVSPTRRQAADGIPFGTVAEAPGRGVVEAWYAEPTTRYDHGVLGDAVEGGALVVVDEAGKRHAVRLDEAEVFEDIAPRIADLNGDGRNDVVAIRSGLTSGAGVVVYGLKGDDLVELAATRPIGRPHRWLNIAGIADFTGDGRADIALVKTPHIGGRLEILTMRGGKLTSVARADGFSNHAIGSAELGLSAVVDGNGDGVVDLALPDARRRTLILVSARGGRLKTIVAVPLGGAVATAIGVVETGRGPALVVGLDDGRLAVVRED